MPYGPLRGAAGLAAIQKQAFGAAVVSKTMDYMNNFSGSRGASFSAAPVDKQTFGAAVVSRTLDTLNSGQGYTHRNQHANQLSGADYGFQKDVLGAYMAGKGTIADMDT